VGHDFLGSVGTVTEFFFACKNVSTKKVVTSLQLHGGLCGKLAVFVKRLQGLGPALDVERTWFQKSGVQALCALQLALDKARSLLQYCADSSKLYLVAFITISLWFFSVNL
jgi:hypothetical protein